ncbi:MAG: hypothetical protein IJ323_03010 [Clostridia bacterium]|nr:hypothetical protein [Clostridia bacterium]
MKSSSLKILLALLFLLVSAFFVFKISGLYASKNIFTDEEITEAVKVINEKGVKIKAEAVIKEKNVPNVIKLEFNSLSSESIAKRLMRGEYGSFTIPSGFSYTNDTESLSFSNNYDLEYIYLPSKVTEADITDALKSVNGTEEKGKKSVKKLSETFFKNINSDPYEVSLKLKKSVTKGSLTYLEAVQCVDSYEIEGAGVIVALSSDKPVYISGKLFFAESYNDYETDAFDSINILFEIEKSDVEIQSMELIYAVVFDKKSSVYLTPSYRFSYSDEGVQIYDATSASKRSS